MFVAIKEFKQDKLLRIISGIFALFNFVHPLEWYKVNFARYFYESYQSVCWPFFPTCAQYKFSDLNSANYMFLGLGLLALVNSFLFFKKSVAIKWPLLMFFILSTIKYGMWAMDYRFRGNPAYMAFWVSITLLFLPNKRITLAWLMIMFYFWAGIIKLNTEWVSGAALYGPKWYLLGVQYKPIQLYVIVLETIFCWGLLAKNSKVFWFSFVQFVAFHAWSYFVVGLLYPTFMLLILSLFAVYRIFDKSKIPYSLNFKSMPLSTLFVLAIFCFLQLWPKLIPGDEALTNEGRRASLHMFDATAICEKWAIIETRENTYKVDIHTQAMIRHYCDPVVVTEYAKTLCKNFTSKNDFVSLRLRLKSKRTTEKSFTEIIDYTNFCKNPPTFKLFWINDWIIANRS